MFSLPKKSKENIFFTFMPPNYQPLNCTELCLAMSYLALQWTGAIS